MNIPDRAALASCPAWASGFHYYPDALDPHRAELIAAHCLAALDTAGSALQADRFANNGRSRVVRYGFDIRHADYVATPRWVTDLRAELAAVAEIAIQVAATDSFTINEYLPGDSIHMHADTFRYADGIVTVSAGAHACLVLERSSTERFEIVVAPGSVYVLCGDAQWRCRHGFEARPDQSGARHSVVFRRRAWSEGERRIVGP